MCRQELRFRQERRNTSPPVLECNKPFEVKLIEILFSNSFGKEPCTRHSVLSIHHALRKRLRPNFAILLQSAGLPDIDKFPRASAIRMHDVNPIFGWDFADQRAQITAFVQHERSAVVLRSKICEKRSDAHLNAEL